MNYWVAGNKKGTAFQNTQKGDFLFFLIIKFIDISYIDKTINKNIYHFGNFTPIKTFKH